MAEYLTPAEHLTPAKPRVLSIEGIEIKILMTKADTGGAFGMIETTVPPEAGPRKHVHSREDETFYVVSGVAEFTVGDVRTTCGAGSLIFGPRGTPHAYRNVGTADLKVVIVYTPGGAEESFQEWGDATDVSQIPEIFARYGLKAAE